jgi:hypothetical protein
MALNTTDSYGMHDLPIPPEIRVYEDRFMLCEDTEAVYAGRLQAGLDAGMSAPHGNPMPQDQVPSCKSSGNGM